TRLFVAEALVLSAAGSLIGVAGAIGYASLLVTGLRTVWVDAVGTEDLTLHVSGLSLLAGGAGGVAAAVACIWLTLGTMGRVSERSLLAGQLPGPGTTGGGAGRTPLAGIAVACCPAI